MIVVLYSSIPDIPCNCSSIGITAFCSTSRGVAPGYITDINIISKSVDGIDSFLKLK